MSALSRADAIVQACEESQGSDLILNQCDLSSFPDAYTRCAAHVKRVYLRANRLAAVPSQLLVFAKLSLLDLSCNQLTELPAAVSSLKALRVLLLNGNRISSLPACLGELTSLRVLDVSDNPDLATLPEQLGSCDKLEVLACRRTLISQLPLALSKLSKLRKLSSDVEITGELAKVYSKRGFRLKAPAGDTKKPPPKKK